MAASSGYGEMYKWTDEKGTVHFADDLSHVPEKHRPSVEIRRVPGEIPPSEDREKPAPLPALSNMPESGGIEVDLIQK